jgi:glycosyltransferase involved in cell wall biosynthesis
MKKVFHIITGIGAGGAERVLHNILSNDTQNDHYIVSLKKKNFIKTPYDFSDFKIKYLNLNSFNFIKKFIYLIYYIKKIKPHVVQTWMYHADFFGGLAAKIAGIKNILWNIRNSNLDKKSKFSTKLVLKINALLSKFIPNKIISCSKNAIKIHLNKGYKENFSFIGNGINKKKPYYCSNNLKLKFFNNKNFFIITYAGRWHLQKDFETLFKSLKILKHRYKTYNWKILMAGSNLDKINNDFYKLIKINSLQNEVKLIGQLQDINKLYAISDLNVLSSSHGEAFPNVIMEAMSQGVPCVSTDVGESKSIVSNHGWCVEIKNPDKFAKCIYEAINLKKNLKMWNNLKFNCKMSIYQRFGLDKMISSYNELWNK